MGLSTKVDLHGGKIPASLWKDADPQDLAECRKIFRGPTITKPEELFSDDFFSDDFVLEEKHRKKNNPEENIFSKRELAAAERASSNENISLSKRTQSGRIRKFNGT